MSKKITLKDTDLLNRFPVGKWFAAGAYSVHGAKVARLFRLGLLERRMAGDLKLGRTWDYLRPR